MGENIFNWELALQTIIVWLFYSDFFFAIRNSCSFVLPVSCLLIWRLMFYWAQNENIYIHRCVHVSVCK